MIIRVNKFLTPLVSISFLASSASLVQAREIKTQEDYQLYCGVGAYQYDVQSSDCPQFREVLDDKQSQQNKQKEFRFEPKRRNIERKQEQKSKKKISGYIGTTILGIYTNNNSSIGVRGSIFGGVKFNHFIGLDAEVGAFYDLYESRNSSDLGWFSFINPRFFLPLSETNKHFAMYVSPGIGISQVLDGAVTDNTLLTWQIKGGIAIPIYKKLGGYGEIRYVDQFSDEGDDIFSTELGLTLRL